MYSGTDFSENVALKGHEVGAGCAGARGVASATRGLDVEDADARRGDVRVVTGGGQGGGAGEGGDACAGRGVEGQRVWEVEEEEAPDEDALKRNVEEEEEEEVDKKGTMNGTRVAMRLVFETSTDAAQMEAAQVHVAQMGTSHTEAQMGASNMEAPMGASHFEASSMVGVYHLEASRMGRAQNWTTMEAAQMQVAQMVAGEDHLRAFEKRFGKEGTPARRALGAWSRALQAAERKWDHVLQNGDISIASIAGSSSHELCPTSHEVISIASIAGLSASEATSRANALKTPLHVEKAHNWLPDDRPTNSLICSADVSADVATGPKAKLGHTHEDESMCGQGEEGGAEEWDADAAEVVCAFERLSVTAQSSWEDDRGRIGEGMGEAGLEDVLAEACRLRAEVCGWLGGWGGEF